MSFRVYLLRRILFVIPILFGITIIAFLIANAVPADPINANLPTNALNNEEMVQAFREKWGLDKPPVEQYLTYIGNLLRGDMGISIKTRNPVAEDIAQFLPATVELATVAIVYGIFIGVGLGVASAIWKNTIIDYIARVVALIGVSFPVFLLALGGLTVFHAQLGWVAGPGRLGIIMRDPPTVTGLFLIDTALAGEWVDKFQSALSHLVLPALVLALYISGIISRITRSSLLEVLGMDYIRTARSKGISERRVLIRHGLSTCAHSCHHHYRFIVWQSTGWLDFD